jgi:biopolymer transport protein TolQ
MLNRAERDAAEFEHVFWTGGNLNKLFENVTAGRRSTQGMASIFEAGFKEYAKLKRQGGMEVSIVMEGARRAMRAAYNREMDDLDAHLPFLASVGSVSPYIGLLGTVWGIMNAFRGLANVAQATLAHVAPGIAEALVATAMGLFAAIPAVVAYNRFAAGVDRLAVRYESFMEEFMNILQRKN